VMLAAPELVVAEPIYVLDELQIAAKLQGGIFADRVVGREERAKT